MPELFVSDTVAIEPLRMRGVVIGVQRPPGRSQPARYAIRWFVRDETCEGWFTRSQLKLVQRGSVVPE